MASAAVQVDKAGPALQAMLEDVKKFASDGLTNDEVAKTRLQSRSELVQLFEGMDSAAMRLARDAALGLPADYEAQASLRRDSASRDDLERLVRAYYDTKPAVIVVVGPRARVEPQLQKIGLTTFELRDAEGRKR
jgi:predicted Zn-dependent peptidase